MQRSHCHSNPRRVRAIFISDVHLGSKYAHADELLSFLKAHDPLYVYIVGDFIDGWRLRRSWHWQPTYNRILGLLFRWAHRGVTIRYLPGNHDALPAEFLTDFGLFEVARQFIHVGPDGRRYLVTHGDQFEASGICAPWKVVIGGLAYDVLLWSNHVCNVARRWLGKDAIRFSTTVKTRVKTVLRAMHSYTQRVVDYARSQGCDGIVCGHIHQPGIVPSGSVTYCNTGDWVENCTALIEEFDGTLRIARYERQTAVPGEQRPLLAARCSSAMTRPTPTV